MNPQTQTQAPSQQTKQPQLGPKTQSEFDRLLSKEGIVFTPFGAQDTINLTVENVQEFIAVKTKSGRTCSRRDAAKFIRLCQTQRLNPWAGDAYLVGYDKWDKSTNSSEPVFSLITAHQVFLKRAEASPDFDGMESGVIIRTKEGTIEEREGDFADFSLDKEGNFEDGEDVIGGWAKVYRKNLSKPFYRRLAIKAMRPNYDTPFWSDAKSPGQIVKCFDEETQVLTTRGFEAFATAEGSVLQVTDQGLQPTESVPFFQPYTGEMIEWTSRNGNFRVSANHDLPLSINGEREMPVEAKHLMEIHQRDRVLMPLALTFDRRDFPIDDRIIQLASAYVADGSDNSRSSGFCIRVSRPEKIMMLRALGLHCSERDNQCSGGVAIASSGREIVTRSNKRAFYYSRSSELDWLVGRSKVIAIDSLLSLSQRQAKLFVDTWLSLDGHRPDSCVVGRVYMTRPHHCQAFELASVAAGYSVSSPASRVSDIGKRNFSFTLRGASDVRLLRQCGQIQKNANTGGVWCVKVPSGKIVVRRHGFSCVSHNCAEGDALRSAFPSLLGGLYTHAEQFDITQIVSDSKPANGKFEPVSRGSLVESAKPKEETQTVPAPEAQDESNPDLNPQRPTEPAPSTNPKSAVDELQCFVLAGGFTFDHLKAWGEETKRLDNADSLTGFGDISDANAKRLLRIKSVLLDGLAEVKGRK